MFFYISTFCPKQKCLQSAENRSKKLGISNMSKLPLTESNVKATPLRQNSMKSNVGSPKRSKSTDKKSSMVSPSPSKNGRLALRTFPTEREVSIDAKENADLALEINITTGPNVQVKFQLLTISFFPLSKKKKINVEHLSREPN